ncbi:MAG TPA: cytochrome c oxidase subunit 3 [Candidatus Sulfotelmatobacter sp.]|jgi:cytochrome c oxidase subunit 3|nr:cytochrome c oxidase subunit 3 [Candidatus Sulfotelmatobacter sp.]
MATTIPPPQIDVEEELHPNVRLDDGSGGGVRGSVPAGGELRAVKDPAGEPTRTGIWVGLAAIGMMFAALTSALYVREGSATDWHPIVLPPILFFNTLALIASSITLEVARRRVAAYMRGKESSRSAPTLWLNATMVLGLVFVVGQYLAWLKLRSEGLYLPTNPNSSFFYVFTGVHVVHVVGGLGGLTRVMVKFRSAARVLRRSTIDATSYYWHFMGLLWMYLLFILWLKL